jgi:hypothetical protein
MQALASSLNEPADYLTRGWVSISIPNLIVLTFMVTLFVLALLLPFPGGRQEPEQSR